MARGDGPLTDPVAASSSLTANPSRLRRAALQAAGGLAAVIASFVTVYGLCLRFGADTQPAIVAAIVAIALSRRAIPARSSHAATLFLALACVAPLTVGVGLLLRTVPLLGAAVFTAGMFLSVWLRNYGSRASYIGALVALPLVAMLIVPPPLVHAPGGRLANLLLVVSAGLIALGYVVLIQWIAARAGMPLVSAVPVAPESAKPAARAGISAHTRMAWQTAVAIAAAFAVGFLVFPKHWGWTVLTAYIVCSGALGRGDAAYKGVLRLAGALAGTLGAALFAHLWAPSGVGEAVAIFAVLYVGLWLRDINYAYWAACMTLILALLSRSSNGIDVGLLGVRLEAILAGAVCAVAAAWFVFPIRTEAIVRRYLADALLAFDELVAHAHVADDGHTGRFAYFEHRMKELDRLAPPVRWHRRVFARGGAPDHPAEWIDLAGGLRDHAQAFRTPREFDETYRARVRRAIGLSRRAIGNHGKPDAPPDRLPIGTALNNVHTALASSSPAARVSGASPTAPESDAEASAGSESTLKSVAGAERQASRRDDRSP